MKPNQFTSPTAQPKPAGPVTEEINQRWRTPRYLFEFLHDCLGFTVDACADSNNHLLPRYWTLADDAITQDWSDERVFCNPPFSGAEQFLEKAGEARLAVVVFLLNALTSPTLHDNPPGMILMPDYRIQFDPPPRVERKTFKQGTCLLVYGRLGRRELACIEEMRHGIIVPRKREPRRWLQTFTAPLRDARAA
jgi:phage N-6-adenine-methyltransferase